MDSQNETRGISHPESDTIEISIDQPSQQKANSFTFLNVTDRQQDFKIKDTSSESSIAKKDLITSVDIDNSKSDGSQINHISDNQLSSATTNVDIELFDATMEDSVISKELDTLPSSNGKSINKGIYDGYKDVDHSIENHFTAASKSGDNELLDESVENSLADKDCDTTVMNNDNAVNIEICDSDKVILNSEKQCTTEPNNDFDMLVQNCEGIKDCDAMLMNACNASNKEIHSGVELTYNSVNQCSTTPCNVGTSALLDGPMGNSVFNEDLDATAIYPRLNANPRTDIHDGKVDYNSDNQCTTEVSNVDIELVDEPMDCVVTKDLDVIVMNNGNATTEEIHDDNKSNHIANKQPTTEATISDDIKLLDEPMEEGSIVINDLDAAGLENCVNRDSDATAINTTNNIATSGEIHGDDKLSNDAVEEFPTVITNNKNFVIRKDPNGTAINNGKPMKKEERDGHSGVQCEMAAASTDNGMEDQRNSANKIQSLQLSNEITTTNNNLPIEDERKENSQTFNNQSPTAATKKSAIQEHQSKQHSHNLHDNESSTKPPRKRPYKCKVCGKTFDRGHRFDRHARTHTKGAITCHICGKIFAGKASLASHMYIHSGTKSHQCKTCGKCFTQAGNLQVHERVHTGIKPYKCDICGKDFSQIGNLRAHIRIHTGDMPYRCKLCEGKFRQLSHLISHEKNFHNLK